MGFGWEQDYLFARTDPAGLNASGQATQILVGAHHTLDRHAKVHLIVQEAKMHVLQVVQQFDPVEGGFAARWRQVDVAERPPAISLDPLAEVDPRRQDDA